MLEWFKNWWNPKPKYENNVLNFPCKEELQVRRLLSILKEISDKLDNQEST